jgi:DNA-binding IclR family transcriptional regulator
VTTPEPKPPSIGARALAVLELIAGSEEPLSLSELIAATHWPKATVHRFAVLLEQLGFAQRTLDGKRYAIGPRLSQLAANAMRHSLQWGPRRAILTALVSEIGETCNITVLDGNELIYLDRVESAWPLQIRLNVGSRVPLHCTASGKLFLSLSPPALRQSLIAAASLKKYTSRTITDPVRLTHEIERIKETGIGSDDEEFIEGMAAAAVPVLDQKGRICATVAVHGPVGRLSLERAVALAPALKRAADKVAQTYLRKLS